MNDKTRNKISFKFGIGSLAPIVSVLGIVIWWLSSIVVDAKKVLDVPEWICFGMILLGWCIGNKYHTDFGAKCGKNIAICFALFMIMMMTLIFVFNIIF